MSEIKQHYRTCNICEAMCGIEVNDKDYTSEFPVAALAEEILAEGEGQLRAMFTIAGNPVLSAPGGDDLDEAFAQLDYMVAVDIYLNETTRHANIILPTTHGLEVPHFDVFFNSFAVHNTVKYSEALFEKTGNHKLTGKY